MGKYVRKAHLKKNPSFDERYKIDQFKHGATYRKTDNLLCLNCRKVRPAYIKKCECEKVK